MRTAFGLFVTAQFVFLALFALAMTTHVLPGVARFPQWLAVSALLLGLVSVFPLRMRGWGTTALYGRLIASPRVHRWIEGYRPFQFAAVVGVLSLAAVERIPALVPRLVADVSTDLATRGIGETVVAWTVLGGLGAAIGLLLGAFAVAVILDALGLIPRPSDPAETANLVVLWNVLLAIVGSVATLSDLFGGTPEGPDRARWWLHLLFALAVVRSTFVVSVLMALDWLGLSMDEVLSRKAAETRIGRAATGIGLLAAGLGFLWLEPRIGVAGAAALIAVVSHPAARLLERVQPRTVPSGD